MQKNLIRILFLFLFIFLLGQFYVAKKFYEPYPAIVYPAFDWVPDNSKYNEYFKTEIIAVYDNGAQVTLGGNVFWHEISYDLWQKIVNKYVYNHDLKNIRENTERNELRGYLKRKAEQVQNTKLTTLKIIQYRYREFYRDFPTQTEKILWQSGEMHFD